MAYFPVFIDLKDKKCVIIGGGRVAARKAKRLFEAGADVTVAAPEISEDIRSLGVKTVCGEAETAYMDGAFMVICAAGDPEVNSRFAQAASERGIPCDVADCPEKGSFIFPSVIREGAAVIGISTGGSAPSAARYLKNSVRSALPENTKEATAALEKIRACVKKSGMTADEKRRLMNDITERLFAGAPIRIGTRKSELAVIQGRRIGELLKTRFGVDYEIVTMSTAGDRNKDARLSELDGKGMFVAEFEQALLRGRIDAAVHSAKDLPSALADGLEISAVAKRDDPFDVLITRAGTEFFEADSFIAGTSSARREMLIKRRYPSCRVKFLRGNVGTRLEKLKSGEYDALILAKAGLDRLGVTDKDISVTELGEKFVPAACQGIIAAECVSGSAAAGLLSLISDADTMAAFETERMIMRLIGADCSEPAGAYAKICGGMLHISAVYGKSGVIELSGAVGDRAALAKKAAAMLEAENER